MAKTFLILFGAPGSGKGTQAIRLADKMKLPMVSTGDLLRAELEKNSPLGRIAKKYMDKGKLVPDELLAEFVEHRLKKADARAGAIFDGFPRNEEQQEFILRRIKPALRAGGRAFAVLIDSSDKAIKARLGGRRACACGAVYNLKTKPPKRAGVCDLCGKKIYTRDDDKPKVIADRLKLYHKQSEPLLDYWRSEGKLIEVNGDAAIDEVWKELEGKIKEKGLI
jgi:adenylate kinase